MTATESGAAVPATPPTNGGLECRGVSAGYGRLIVVRDVDLVARPGEVVALLGPNGAGKSTLLNCIAGFVPRSSGEVLVDGSPLPSGRPTVAVKRGVGLVPDDRALFMRLSVRENLEVARDRGSPEARSVLERFPALERRWTVPAGNLSGGEQQMLAVARALLRRPRILLIDEMSMGLAPLVVEGLMPMVRQVAHDLQAVVVIVEQHVRLALDVADRAVVMVHGRVRLGGTATELAGDVSRLEAAYLGSEAGPDAGPDSLRTAATPHSGADPRPPAPETVNPKESRCPDR